MLEQLTLVKSRTWDNPQRPLGNLASASPWLWQARRSGQMKEEQESRTQSADCYCFSLGSSRGRSGLWEEQVPEIAAYV